MIAFVLATFVLFSNPAVGLTLAIALNKTGKSATTSNPQEDHIRKGADLALKSKKLTVQWIDHGESVVQTLKAIEEINRQKPRVVVGMGNSFQALLAADRMNHHTVLISPVATADAILEKKSNILLLSNLNSIQSKLLAREIKSRARTEDRILLVELTGCPYCVDMSAATVSELRRQGLEPQILKLDSSQINDLPKSVTIQRDYAHIVLPVFEVDAARLISLLAGNNPKAIFWGGDGWGNLARYIRELPIAKSVRAIWLSHYHWDIETPENKTFVKAFRREYGVNPVDTSAFFFEATQIAQKLIGEPDPRKRMLAFDRIQHYKGLTGNVTIQGDHVIRPMPLIELVAGEPKLVRVVRPEERQ